MYAPQDLFFDRAHQERKKVSGVVEYDFTPDTTLTAGGSYQWDDALPVAEGLLCDPHRVDANWQMRSTDPAK